MNPQSNKTVITEGIPTWLHNRYVRMWSYFIITPEGNFYVQDGERIAEKIFEETYPIDQLEIA